MVRLTLHEPIHILSRINCASDNKRIEIMWACVEFANYQPFVFVFEVLRILRYMVHLDCRRNKSQSELSRA